MSTAPQGPRCPMCDCLLQPTGDVGVGICPVGDIMVYYEAEKSDQSTKKDKFGRLIQSYIITRTEGDHE